MTRRRGRIVVAAGTNGAGKTSIVGEFLGAAGGRYFNPDLFARKLIDRGIPPAQANAAAWKLGFEGLQRAVADNEDFAFETTLGGSSIVRELRRAIKAGRDVRVFYVGLASPEQHIARVEARVVRGGHDIPAPKIRERYSRSLANLISLVGKADRIEVFDNSRDTASGIPAPQLVLRLRKTKIIEPGMPTLLAQAPHWAKPVVAAAIAVQPAQDPL